MDPRGRGNELGSLGITKMEYSNAVYLCNLAPFGPGSGLIPFQPSKCVQYSSG